MDLIAIEAVIFHLQLAIAEWMSRSQIYFYGILFF